MKVHENEGKGVVSPPPPKRTAASRCHRWRKAAAASPPLPMVGPPLGGPYKKEERGRVAHCHPLILTPPRGWPEWPTPTGALQRRGVPSPHQCPTNGGPLVLKPGVLWLYSVARRLFRRARPKFGSGSGIELE
ncbi:hypothetical protein Scep_016062 [Stephania cephalantha]|uniref:Uncharacterized protein n=1 Tax=Stephania cephalantha TaxID=152367 RepID=A0AAP0NTV2_9MAGN